MRTKSFLMAAIWCMGLVACDKEDETHATDWDINWYEINDRPGELNHLIYRVYTETGIPIFYNDTIGSQIVDYDYEGHPIIYYEQLRPGYTIQTNSDDIHYVLSADTASLMVAVETFCERVIPELPEAIFSRCYLLVDSLVTTGYYGVDVSWPIDKAAEKYMATTIVGRIAGLKLRTEKEVRAWAGNLVAELLVNYVKNNYEKQLTDFYLLSYTSAGKSKYRAPLVGFGNSKIAQNWGFIDFAYSNVTPSESEDIAAFVALFYNGETEEEFRTRFEKWPKVLKKYELMREIVDDIRAKARGKSQK